MFKNPRQFAEDLLYDNRVAFGVKDAFAVAYQAIEGGDAALAYPQVPAQFWQDVLDALDDIREEDEAEFAQGCDDGQGPRYGYDTTGGECEWGID